MNRQWVSTEKKAVGIASSTRATRTSWSRSAVESNAAPSSRTAVPSGPGSARPRAVTHRVTPSARTTRYSAAYSPAVSIASRIARCTSGTSSGCTAESKLSMVPPKLSRS